MFSDESSRAINAVILLNFLFPDPKLSVDLAIFPTFLDYVKNVKKV